MFITVHRLAISTQFLQRFWIVIDKNSSNQPTNWQEKYGTSVLYVFLLMIRDSSSFQPLTENSIKLRTLKIWNTPIPKDEDEIKMIMMKICA